MWSLGEFFFRVLSFEGIFYEKNENERGYPKYNYSGITLGQIGKRANWIADEPRIPALFLRPTLLRYIATF